MGLDFKTYAFSISAVAALLAGCGGSQPSVSSARPNLLPPAGSPLAKPAVAKPLAGYESVYSFQASPDGQNPDARVIPFGSSLYGSTTIGGGSGCGGKGCGTLFKVSKAGLETVLHRFAGHADGAKPEAE
ncbi:MAG TPA: hypothetical protein VHS56_01590, partial [Candidatus Cybelea sp.]|nr:hypothetical protein [Candidatus Cybelea sp.]